MAHGALLLCGMWDLLGPGLEPASSALAGGLLTTAPPGKPLFVHMSIYLCRIQVLVQSDNDLDQDSAGGAFNCYCHSNAFSLSLFRNKLNKCRHLAHRIQLLCCQMYLFHLFLLFIVSLNKQQGLRDTYSQVTVPTLHLYHLDSFLCLRVDLYNFDFLTIPRFHNPRLRH